MGILEDILDNYDYGVHFLDIVEHFDRIVDSLELKPFRKSENMCVMNLNATEGFVCAGIGMCTKVYVAYIIPYTGEISSEPEDKKIMDHNLAYLFGSLVGEIQKEEGCKCTFCKVHVNNENSTILLLVEIDEDDVDSSG